MITDERIRKFILTSETPVPNDVLEYFTAEWESKVGDFDGLLDTLNGAGYLNKFPKENTRQARRQYVYDCIKAGKVLTL